MNIFIVLILSFFSSVTIASQAKIDEVRVYKGKHRMDLISAGNIVKSYHVMLGRGGKGPKRKEGDKLVPEGKYFLDYKNPYSDFYKSIHVSYPNAEDIKRAEASGVPPGGDIMIHGFPNRPTPFFKFLKRFGMIKLVDWTAGCVSVTDEEMDEIYHNLDEQTPISIYH